MKTCALGLGLAAVVAASASADYTGVTVDARAVSTTDFGGATVDVYVIDVYLTSNDLWEGTDGSGDTLLNVYNWNSGSGAPASFFQSATSTGWLAQNAGGIFDNAALQEADSFVTIGGFGSDALQAPGAGADSGLDPNFGGNNVAAPLANAGWFNGNPPSYNGAAMVYDNGVEGTLIGRFASTAEFSLEGTSFEITYNQGLGTGGQQASFVIPAPGAVALLGLAGVFGRRRRG